MYIEDENIIPSQSAQLCLHCGLCCMGYFHDKAIINNKEDLKLAINMGASIVEYPDNKQYFALPCQKFDGKCSVYPDRPSVCENHQCNLLKSVLEGEIELEKAIRISDEMKMLCKTLDTLIPDTNTGTLRARILPLFSSENAAIIKKKHPHLMLNYAAYQLLKNKYFYQEKDFY